MVKLGDDNARGKYWEVALLRNSSGMPQIYHLDSVRLKGGTSFCVNLTVEEIMDLYESLHVFLMAQAEKEGEEND
jgi:hypothetical protein